MLRKNMACLFAVVQLETLSGFFLVKFSPGPTDNTMQEAAVAASYSSPLRTMFRGADKCSLSSGAWETTMLRTNRWRTSLQEGTANAFTT